MLKNLNSIWVVAYFWMAATSVATAAMPDVYTNDNFFAVEHDRPHSFTQDLYGNFYGVTDTGKIFRQYSVTNDMGVRLQRFEIDQAFFYISDRGVILATSDIAALSMYLTRT